MLGAVVKLLFIALIVNPNFFTKSMGTPSTDPLDVLLEPRRSCTTDLVAGSFPADERKLVFTLSISSRQ